MPLLDDMTHELDDPRLGTPIPYCPYHQVEDSYAGPVLQLGYETGSNATMTYITPWQYMPRFCQLMLGDNYVDSDDTQNRLYRIPPHTLPIYSSTDEVGAVDMFTNFYATHIVQVAGIPGPDPYYPTSGTKVRRPTFGAVDGDESLGVGLKYAYAKVTVQYSPLPYIVDTEENVEWNKEWKRFVTVQRTPRVELLGIMNNQLKWVPDKQGVPHATPTRDESIDYVVTWHRVPFVISDYDQFIGYANDADNFLEGHPQVPSSGFTKDQMLLVGVQETLIPQPWSLGDTTLLFNYAFFFQFKSNGHNKGLRITNPGTPTASVAYNAFSLTGTAPADGVGGNATRAIKHAVMANLFLPR